MKIAGHIGIWGVILVLLAAQLVAFEQIGPSRVSANVILLAAVVQVMLMALFYQRLASEAKGVWMVMAFGVVTVIALLGGLLLS